MPRPFVLKSTSITKQSMNNKTIIIVIGLILIMGTGLLVYSQKNAALQNSMANEPAMVENTESTSDTMSNTSDTTMPANDQTPTSSGITTADVATHNNADSCWAIINGSVYDLTGWIPNHPGGPQAILQLCGTDGTAKFTTQHGGNSRVLSVLAGFKIGSLSN